MVAGRREDGVIGTGFDQVSATDYDHLLSDVSSFIAARFLCHSLPAFAMNVVIAKVAPGNRKRRWADGIEKEREGNRC